MDVARAFQPEFCPLRLDCLEIDAAGPGCRRLASREAAKPQSSKGAGTWGRGDWCDVLSGSAFHFLQSTFYGMDAIPPHPRPLSPVSRGRGEDWWSVVRHATNCVSDVITFFQVAATAQDLDIRFGVAAAFGDGNDVVVFQVVGCAAVNAFAAVSRPDSLTHISGDVS